MYCLCPWLGIRFPPSEGWYEPPAQMRFETPLKNPPRRNPMKDDKHVVAQAPSNTSRRKFIAGAAGASALAFPMISKGQTGPITLRFQSTWPTKDIFHEYALDYAKKVNDLAGGELKIGVLPAGAVVPAFGLIDAVSK